MRKIGNGNFIVVCEEVEVKLGSIRNFLLPRFKEQVLFFN